MLATRPQPRTASKRSKQFTRADYHAMGRAGILTAGDRVELLEGEIIVMSPIGTRHASCVDRLTHALTTSNRLAGRALVRVQSPLAESDRSEPQPDLMLLAHRDDWYAREHPGPADVLLLVEVADSSLDYDRDTKIPTYAAAGIREVAECGSWIWNTTGSKSTRSRRAGITACGNARRSATPSPRKRFPICNWT